MTGKFAIYFNDMEFPLLNVAIEDSQELPGFFKITYPDDRYNYINKDIIRMITPPLKRGWGQKR